MRIDSISSSIFSRPVHETNNEKDSHNFRIAALPTFGMLNLMLNVVGAALNQAGNNNLVSHPADKDLLHKAQSHHQINIVEILLEYGNNPKGWPAICYAAYLGHENVVRALVEHGADVKTKCNGGSVLDFAVDSGNVSLVKFVVNKGAVMDRAYFDRCISREFKEGVLLYFEKENKIDPNELCVILRDSILNRSVDLIKLLIDRGPNLNYLGNTLLAYAVNRGDLDLIKYLVSKGAPINFVRKQAMEFEVLSNNPIVCAAARGRTEILQFLFESGGNIPQNAETIIWPSLFQFYNLETIRLLVSKGLKINCQFQDGKNNQAQYVSPLQKAVMLKNIDLVSFLLENAANVKDKGGLGKTPLKLALEGGNRAIIDLLIKYGARIEDV